MIPRHHASDWLIMSYAAGTLSAGLSLVLATHLQVCPVCRRAAAEAEALGGALLDALPPEPLDADAFARTLAMIDMPQAPAPGPSAAGPRGEKGAATAFAFPPPLGRVLGQAGVQKWRWLAPGIQQIEVPSGGASGGVRLLRIAPGQRMPEHGHSGSELTLVFSGAFEDERGRYEAGDLAEENGDSRHRPVADAKDGCVCVIATEGPLRFSGRLERFLQPFLRF